MRIALDIDGATTAEVRRMAVALHRAGHTGELTVGCDGPELWNARTPKLRPHEWGILLKEMA